MIDKPAFDELARRRGRLLATIYQPTHAATGAAQEDLVRLRHVLEDIEKLANGGRVSHAMATTIRRRVHELDETELFGRGAGYAIFASPTDVRIVRMQRPVEELVYVGDRFCLRPLFGQLGDDSRFHLLTLSRNAVRLVECEGGDAKEVALGTVEKGLAALPRVAEGGSVLQSHSAGAHGGRAEMFHGQGGAADLHKDEFRRLVRRLDEVLMEKVGDNPPPLVVAGVRYEADMFRRASRHPRLCAETLEGNVDHDDCTALCRRAREIAARSLDVERSSQVARVRNLLDRGAASTETAAILAAAHRGRVGTLLLRTQTPLWGTFDAGTGAAHLRAERAPGDDDLLDLALSCTLDRGGRAIAVDGADLPGGVPMAAVLRG